MVEHGRLPRDVRSVLILIGRRCGEGRWEITSGMMCRGGGWARGSIHASETNEEGRSNLRFWPRVVTFRDAEISALGVPMFHLFELSLYIYHSI